MLAQIYEMVKVYGPIKTQADAAIELARAATKQLEELKRQSDAFDRLSTVGRAYLTVEFDSAKYHFLKIENGPRGAFGVEQFWGIKNIGDTPATITQIIATYHVRLRGDPLNITFPDDSDIFEDVSRESAITHPLVTEKESIEVIAMRRELGNNTTAFRPQRIVGAKESTGIGRMLFGFNSRPDITNSIVPIELWPMTRGFLKIIIQYDDIFGRARETCFFARGDGRVADAGMTKANPPEKRCNYWK